jgi:hypothetical protein
VFDHRAFAAELAKLGDVADVLLEKHIDDGTGRCKVCSTGNQSGHHRYPCTLRNLAVEALVIQARAQMDDPPRPIRWRAK